MWNGREETTAAAEGWEKSTMNRSEETNAGNAFVNLCCFRHLFSLSLLYVSGLFSFSVC